MPGFWIYGLNLIGAPTISEIFSGLSAIFIPNLLANSLLWAYEFCTTGCWKNLAAWFFPETNSPSISFGINNSSPVVDEKPKDLDIFGDKSLGTSNHSASDNWVLVNSGLLKDNMTWLLLYPLSYTPL